MIESKIILAFVVPVALGVAILLIGLVLLAIDSRRRKRFVEAETYNWTTTGGKVTSAQLEKCQNGNGSTKNGQQVLEFVPVVEYAYNVAGADYSRKNSTPGDCETYTEAEAKEFLDKYPVGTYVPVRYDPEDPSKATLEDKPRRNNRVRMIGLLCTWFGISVCCFTSLMVFVMAGNIL